MIKKELNYDVIILGAGPAGFSCAIYTARGNLKTAVLDVNMFGGQPSNYLEIENYPGFPIIGGCELMEKFEQHIDKFGVEKFPMVEIKNIKLQGKIKAVECNDTVYKAPCIIIATGASNKKLNIKGEEEFKCRGVSYCAVCDGAFYKDKTVTVIGGGNSALEEAVYLTKYAKKVYVVHRRNDFRADKTVQERALNNGKIEFILNCIPVEIQGDNTVKNIVLENVATKEKTILETQGVFPYIGLCPNTDLIQNQIKLNNQGFIETDINMQTSIEGVYAIGDVRNTPLRQVITAAADGAIAAQSAVRYIESIKENIKV